MEFPLNMGPMENVLSGVAKSSILLTVLSCFGYLLSFYVISPMIFENFLLRREFKVGEEKTVEWYCRVNSTVNAVLVCALAALGLAQDYNALTSDVCLGNSEPVKVAFALLCGYSVADILIILLNYEHVGSVIFLVHHTVTAICIGVVTLTETVQYLALLRVIAELSTPFLNARWFLDKLKVSRSSTIAIANGLLMTFVFGLCRVAIIPYCWWLTIPEMLSENWQRCFVTTFGWYLALCIVSLDVLNIYWFWKMLTIVLKVLRSMMQDDSEIPGSNEDKNATKTN